MLSSTGFLTKGGYILRPVVDLFATAVAPPVSTYRLVVVGEFNTVIVDLGLYDLSGQFRI